MSHIPDEFDDFFVCYRPEIVAVTNTEYLPKVE